MRVQNSTYVVNNSTAAGLNFLAKEQNDPSFETTAWFCEKFNTWWRFMTSSSPKNALSLKRPEKYAEARAALMEFMDIVRGLVFKIAILIYAPNIFTFIIGIYVKGGWKPWQKGILIATTAFLSISDKLLEDPCYKFVLGGRFSSNCVENLFSVARMKNKTPTVIQWKNFLKAIILSQYARSVPSSSYEQENTDYFCDGLTLDFLRKGKFLWHLRNLKLKTNLQETWKPVTKIGNNLSPLAGTQI
jgi:hypothetical protein